MKSRNLLVSLAGLAAFAFAAYFCGYVWFARHHGALISLRTGELVFTVPDTQGYRTFSTLYAPLFYFLHYRIHFEPRAAEPLSPTWGR